MRCGLKIKTRGKLLKVPFSIMGLEQNMLEQLVGISYDGARGKGTFAEAFWFIREIETGSRGKIPKRRK